ncbi:Cytochrome b5 reductase 4 [Zostera marina]|uniref:Cytochrome b5 reductase 4 n=1 Tax=Zostera marina TaxID=29655 RepID=A0A0K9P6D7_ZOSMR|nr:Cytochrome b5 reductase 4 [Zostera marina]
MGEGDGSDFTFSKVDEPTSDKQSIESPETILVVGTKAISINDSLSDDSLKKNANSSIEDTYTVNKEIGSRAVGNLKIKEPVVIAKPKLRAKVPFEIGYSPMDWMKLNRTHPDLAGLKGQTNRRPISLAEVKQHKSGDSIWTILKGRVYNISPYMKFHPGGVDMLMKAAGKDCTSLFNKYHAWVNDEFMLEKCLVGYFDDSASL